MTPAQEKLAQHVKDKLPVIQVIQKQETKDFWKELGRARNELVAPQLLVEHLQSDLARAMARAMAKLEGAC